MSVPYAYSTGPHAAALGQRSCWFVTNKDTAVPGLPGGESEASFASPLFNVQHVLNSPVNSIDPTGHCPKPTGDWENSNIICIAGFIPTETTEAIPFIVYFQGDNREFSSNSNPFDSRFWLWIDADSGDIVESFVHGTQRASGPNGEAVGGLSPPRNEPWASRFEEGLFGSNTFSVELGKDGSITLDYHVVCSDPLCNNGLAPNGTITFLPNEYGSFDTSGTVNVFPNLEAYHWNEGE